jgi:hypothetical protein
MVLIFCLLLLAPRAGTSSSNVSADNGVLPKPIKRAIRKIIFLIFITPATLGLFLKRKPEHFEKVSGALRQADIV